MASFPLVFRHFLLYLAVVAASAAHDTGGNTAIQVPPDVPTKLVFAHFMLCFSAFGANESGYQREMAIAQKNNLDGFAVEYLGRDPYYLPNVIAMFSACEAYNAARPSQPPFLLFVIINFCCGLNLTDAVSLYTRFYNSSCLFRPLPSEPLRGAFSSWSAIEWGPTGQINASAWDSQFFAPIASSGLARPYFMPFIYPPNYDVPPTLADQQTILAQVWRQSEIARERESE